MVETLYLVTFGSTAFIIAVIAAVTIYTNKHH